VFVTGLTAIGVTLVFGDALGAWWDEVSSALATPREFRAWVEGLGAWGPVAFFLAQAAQVIVVPIPGTLFPPVGALAFGPWPALGLSLAGMALGSAIVFLVARRWGRPLATRLVGEDLIHRYENLMTARGGLLIWLVFLIPLLPDDAICALAGLSGIPFRRFMVIAVVGRVPAVAMGVFTMAGLEGSPAWVWALVTALAAVALWAGLRYRDVLEQRLLKAMRRGGDQSSSRSGPPLVVTGPVAQEVAPTRSSVGILERETLAGPTRDPLVTVLGAVVATTSVAVLVGVLAGVSGLASGIILIWGVALAVVVAWPRGDG
jgi:uncharacterized membrane protein YdjX (TVP38/TMEM64 family)